MSRRVRILAIAIVVMAAMSSAAMAATIIDFRNALATAGGSVTTSGGDVFGTDLPIGGVEVIDAPMMSGTYPVYGSVTTNGNWGDFDFNSDTGTISIAGCIPGLGLGTLTMAGTCSETFTLLSGTITDHGIDTSLDAITLAGFDTKHPSLLSAIGLDPATPFEFASFMLLNGDPNGTGLVTSVSTDVRNTAVPEPATMMLLGTGLLAAFRARRRTT